MAASKVFGGSDIDFSAALVPTPRYLLVLHDFEARSPDELTLKKGERVELLLDDNEFGDGWYHGRSLVTKMEGLFPQIYTTAIIVQDGKNQPQNDSRTESWKGSFDHGPKSPASYTGSEAALSHSLPPTPGASGVSHTSPLVVEKKASKGLLVGNNSEGTHQLDEKSSVAETHKLNHLSQVQVSVEETLSDIEEAISEISANHKVMKNHAQRHTPNQTQQPPPPPPQRDNDSGSEYSRQDDFNSDSEIEDDEQPADLFSSATYSRDDVASWGPLEVADYLRSKGVSESTCDKFEEQEVTGQILLQLQLPDLKELELGSFGKRFEAWKQIENLQESVQTVPKLRGSTSVRVSVASKEASSRPRSNTGGMGILPRIQSQHNRPASRQSTKYRIDVNEANAYRPNTASQPPGTASTFIDTTPMSAMFERPRSPPASPPRVQSRQYGPGGRDSLQMHSPAMALHSAMSAGTAVLAAGKSLPHQRESSFDRNWKLSVSNSPNRPSTSAGHRVVSTSAATTDNLLNNDNNNNNNKVMERSYFSGGETSSKGGRRLLQKKSAAAIAHQRKTSYTEEQRLRSATALSRHSRIGSTDTVRGGRSESPSSTYSSGTLALNGKDKFRPKSNSFSDSYLLEQPRYSLSPQLSGGKRSTNDSGFGSMSPLPARSNSEKIESTKSPTTSTPAESLGERNRTKSNASAKTEGSATKTSLKEKEDGHKTKAATTNSELRKKSKKHNTSAWQEGLRTITPFEAAKEADFSGWMNKRGSGNISSWKPRFFVLNGSRLSYFYSENDTKERGLIDVTSHKVQAAASDRLVNIHATWAAVTSPSTSPASTATSPHFFKSMESPGLATNGGELSPKKSPLGPNSPMNLYDEEKAAKEKEHKERGWFIFKLVPPAPGASRGVTFTPPRLHYFATGSKEIGRAWMIAIKKATIEIDSSAPVTTSYAAATISLAKARALRTRPPDIALIKPSPSSNGGSSVTDSTNKELGLAITGLDIEEVDHTGDADVEENADAATSRSVSRAGSHVTGGTGSSKKSISDAVKPKAPPSPQPIPQLSAPQLTTKGSFLLSMNNTSDGKSIGSGSLRSPSLEKLLSDEEMKALMQES
ncbi:hypothetical protein DFH27DRAFT_102531 [Peziza echinospora]|nr:hypothetical protein DFH27DRAFT_102531 [Peziza echinospora]